MRQSVHSWSNVEIGLSFALLVSVAALIVLTIVLASSRYKKRHEPILSPLNRTLSQFDQHQPFEAMPHDALADQVYLGRALSYQIDPSLAAEKKQCRWRVILSCTTSPQRIRHLSKVLQVIAPGSYDAIHVNLPKVFSRTGESYSIPHDLSSMGKVEIFTLERDYGPASKLLPTLQRLEEAKEHCLVVTLDDDIAYDCDLVYRLIRAQRQIDGKAVIGMSGLVNERDLSLRQSDNSRQQANQLLSLGSPRQNLKGRSVDILEGLGLVCYPSWLVSSSTLSLCIDSCRQCFTSDDLVISFVLNMHDIPRIEIPYERGLFPFLSYGIQSDALHNTQHHFQAYEACYQHLVKSRLDESHTRQ